MTELRLLSAGAVLLRLLAPARAQDEAIRPKDVIALCNGKDLAGLTTWLKAHGRKDPDKVFSGKVLFVSDVVEPDTRRNKVRIAFDNPDKLMKPNMFANTTFVAPAVSRLVVPTSAVVMGGLAIARVPYGTYLRWIWPLLLLLSGLSVVVLAISAAV